MIIILVLNRCLCVLKVAKNNKFKKVGSLRVRKLTLSYRRSFLLTMIFKRFFFFEIKERKEPKERKYL